MRLLEEVEGESGVRGRLVACECPYETCETVWAFAQVAQAPEFVSRERFWLALGFGPLETIREQVRFMAADVDDDGVRPSEVIDRGVAMVGLRWGSLMDPRTAVAQCDAWRTLPAEVEVVPPAVVWRARGVCFGEPFTRVAAACVATARFYVPDGPVDASWVVR